MKALIRDEKFLEEKRNEIKELLKLKKLNEANTLIRSLNYYQVFEKNEYRIECLENLFKSKKFDTKIFEKLFEVIGTYVSFINKYQVLQYELFSDKDTTSYTFYTTKYGHNTEKEIMVYSSFSDKSKLKEMENILNSKKYKKLISCNMEVLSLNSVKVLLKNKDLIKELIEEDIEGTLCLKLLDILKTKGDTTENIELDNLILMRGLKDFFEKDSAIILNKKRSILENDFNEYIKKQMIEKVNYLLKQETDKIIKFKKFVNVNNFSLKKSYIEKNITKLLSEKVGFLDRFENFSCIYGFSISNIFAILEKLKYRNIEELKRKYEKERYIMNLENF